MNTKLSKLRRTAISAASIPTMALADWSFVELGTLGGSRSSADSINDYGEVIGWSITADVKNILFFLVTVARPISRY